MRNPDYYDGIYQAPIGQLGIKVHSGKLCELGWLKRSSAVPSRQRAAPVVTTIHAWLDAYFAGAVPARPPALLLSGTPFQLRVWGALQQIPHGRVLTYGQLAAQLSTGSRAIGQACRANPVSVIVPCHRVVSANGLGGYGGARGQLRHKRWLLHLEGHG